MKKVIPFLLTIFIFVSCQKSKEVNKIVNADWLLGNWENKSFEGNLEETWKKVNDTTFQATSYFIKEKDTLHFETIKLQKKGEALTYSAAVKGQNNDKAVVFKLTTETEKQLVFENLKHDYPQKISYSQITPDSIVVKISGVQIGKPSAEQYSMKKIK
jgi:stress response protein SCP2